MTNAANEWSKKARVKVLKTRPKRGKCEVRGCNRPIAYMAHIRVTPLDNLENMGKPRGRKERIAEYRRYPKHFRGLCAQHYRTDKKAKKHDKLQLHKAKCKKLA